MELVDILRPTTIHTDCQTNNQVHTIRKISQKITWKISPESNSTQQYRQKFLDFVSTNVKRCWVVQKGIIMVLFRR